MSEFSLELQATAEFHFPESIDSFRKNIPIEWVSEAVNQTGRAAVRKRRFPDSKGDLPPLATSSIVKARQRSLRFVNLAFCIWSWILRRDSLLVIKRNPGFKVLSFAQ